MKNEKEFANSKAYHSFINIHADKLQLLFPLDDANFESDVWRFKHQRDTFTADFTCFRQPYTQFVQYAVLTFNDEDIYISAIELAKILVLGLMEGKAISAHVTKSKDCIALLFSYLKTMHLDKLSEEDLVGMYEVMLTQNPADDSLVSRHSAPAYGSRLSSLDVTLLLRELQSYGLSRLLLPTLSKKHYCSAFNAACLSVMNITLSDYRKGGTFNFLGLDIGRHYIDFCSETFELNVVYATACRLTYQNILKDVETRIKYKTKYAIKRICVETLMGVNLNDIEDYLVKKMSAKPKGIVRRRTLELFSKYYNSISQQVDSFKIENINSIVKKLELPEERFDNQEFVRAMLLTYYYGEHGKSRKNILIEFKSCLSAQQIEVEWDLKEFDKIAGYVDQAILEKPESAFAICKKHYELCAQNRSYRGDVSLSGVEKLRHALMGIEAAGATLFAAMTGWRASEFGFPLSSIYISVNRDTIDSIYTPYRFHVNWVVPKTSSTTPLTREITLAGYVLAIQLAQLNGSKLEQPCLYSLSPRTKYPNHSKVPMESRVEMLWQGFCTHYSLFVELDELELLQSKKHLNESEACSMVYLSSRYDFQSSQVRGLRDLRDSLREQLPRFIMAKDTQEFSFKNQLLNYQKNTLSPQHEALLELYLSDETKNALKLDIIELNAVTVKNISAEFMEGVPYPTAHALRHMWAEAVLRRYRGDIGKFIQANFKHLSESFFMAYIRDKEVDTMSHTSERNVINSVVRDHLLALKDKKREYAGGFDSYLNKVVGLTFIQSDEDFLKCAKKIAEDRVLAFKANAWSACLLRVDSEKTAKCSQDGVPQRQNASPKLCLGCTNADISAGNFNGIVVYTRPEVEACRNPELPAFMKAHCIQVLKPALVQVKKLRKNSGKDKYDKFIAYLEESIEMATKAVEKSNVQQRLL